jgi:fused signal recognition particle receptor
MNFSVSTIAIILGAVLFVALILVTLVRKSSRPVASNLETSKKPVDVPIPLPVDPPVTQVPVSQVSTAEVQVPETNEPSAQVSKGFGKSQGSLTNAFRALFAREQLDDDAWQDLEDTLIMADMGVRAAGEIVATLKSKVRSQAVTDANALFELARTELTQIVDAGLDRTLKTNRHKDAPAVVLTVGVNGTGKTTTTGKIAKLLVSQNKEVLLGAADTFRAAAADQLVTWADRVGAIVVRGAEGSDPAAVAFEAVAAGYDQEVDVVLIDTAGRLHTKQGLMDELGKVFRVASKRGTIDEVLLVIDATTGQNGLNQAKVFSEVVPVTGVVLSKLDGTAKGGIVVAVQQELGVPVKLVGLGEGADDLAVFNPSEFVAGLLA